MRGVFKRQQNICAKVRKKHDTWKLEKQQRPGRGCSHGGVSLTTMNDIDIMDSPYKQSDISELTTIPRDFSLVLQPSFGIS